MLKNYNRLIAVIETPKGCRNKYAYDPKFEAIKLKKILPEGMIFPYNFGFIPNTLSEDGDPSDVLVLMDEPAFPGCVIDVRLLGILKAKVKDNNESTYENNTAKENPRFIAVAEESNLYNEFKSIEDLGRKFLEEVEHFFVNYTELVGKKLIPQGWYGAKEAWDCIKEVTKNYSVASGKS